MCTWSAVVLPILTIASVIAAVMSRFCWSVRPAYHWIVMFGMAVLVNLSRVAIVLAFRARLAGRSLGLARGLLLLEYPRDATASVGMRILDQAIGLSAVVVLGKILGDRNPFLVHEQEAVAVFPLLHLVARADPPTLLRFLLRVRIEVAGAEGLAHQLDVARQPLDDRLGDAAVRVEGRPGLLGVLLRVSPHLVDVRLRGHGLRTSFAQPSAARAASI